jgi:translation initiation factor eIF-2B subunit beta
VERIRQVGRRLTSAQPREVVVGNIVRRVLGLVREVVDDQGDGQTPTGSEPSHSPAHHQHDSLSRPSLASSMSTFSPLKHAVVEPMHMSMISENMSDSGELSRTRCLDCSLNQPTRPLTQVHHQDRCRLLAKEHSQLST